MRKKLVKERKSHKVIYIILFLVLVFFFIRLLSPREIDDVSLEIPCIEIEKYNPDILWVIPKFNGVLISKNQTWCKQILALNKTLGMHGVTHEYEEFAANKSQEYLEEGIQIFKECFGQKPTMFKPPQLKISNKNKELITSSNLTLKTYVHQITHKVYHCNDSGKYKNWFINLF